MLILEYHVLIRDIYKSLRMDGHNYLPTDPLVEILCDPNGLIQVRNLRLLPNGIL